MGYGSYSASDWSKLKQSKGLSKDQNVEEVFKAKSCNPKMDPKYINKRECFDSAEHPNTTPIVVGLDVTGSMGYLAVEIATGALNELITKLYSTGAVEDPALMCAAYGDCDDASPLQVSQFESDIRIAQQLLDLYFEDGGSGQVVPTLLWEFLLEHTEIDAIKKRNQKGFVFTIGDCATIRKDKINETVSRVIGDQCVKTREELLAELEQKFNVFHIVVDSSNGDNAFMSGRIMRISPTEISAIPEIIISTIQMQKGMGIDEAVNQWSDVTRPIVRAAVAQLCLITDNSVEINL